jgi:hypothetical protein
VEEAVEVVTVVAETFGVEVTTDLMRCGTCVATDKAPLGFRRGEGGLLTVALAVLTQRDENCRTRRVPQPPRKRKGDIACEVSFESTEMRAVGDVRRSQSSGWGTPVKMNWEDCDEEGSQISLWWNR